MFDDVALQAESSVQQLQGVLTQREGKITALEEELKQLREHEEQQKSTVRLPPPLSPLKLLVTELVYDKFFSS